jgi:hypothetical protein
MDGMGGGGGAAAEVAAEAAAEAVAEAEAALAAAAGAVAEVGLGRDCGAAAGQLLRSGRMGSCSNSNDGGGKARNG